MTESDPALVDSNILVYAYDISDQEKHNKAKTIMNLAWTRKKVLAFSIQNLSEFVTVSTTKINNPLKIDLVRAIISDILYFSQFKTFAISAEDILTAINFLDKYKLNYWDSLIVAVMHKNKIHTIITENEKDFKKIPWLIVINPFKK